MRHNNNGNNNYRRHRNNGSNNRGHHNNGGGIQRRGPVSLKQQNFDSNGPDVRIRGNAWQVCEKYQSLAKDAMVSGDYTLAESYSQFAEHYQRLINEYNEQNGLNAQGQTEEQAAAIEAQEQAADQQAEQPQDTQQAVEQQPEQPRDQNRRPRAPRREYAAGEGEALRRTNTRPQALPDSEELGLPATLFKKSTPAPAEQPQDTDDLEAVNA